MASLVLAVIEDKVTCQCLDILSDTCNFIGSCLWSIGGQTYNDITINNILLFYQKRANKKTNKFPIVWLWAVTGQRGHQNVETSVTHLAASCLPIFFVLSTFWCHIIPYLLMYKSTPHFKVKKLIFHHF